ncbi:MAG TPA: glycoside hydrolase family 130 protein, partial [Euzebya sp.]|nr:glycoside hydrolase family 130 protein [Euzebya sp.]
MTDPLVVHRSPQRLTADPSRVAIHLFVPGQEPFEVQDSRAKAVVARVLALEEAQVRQSLADVMARFGSRHRDLVGTFRHHADLMSDRLDPDDPPPSVERMLLLGATFSAEYAIEGAALCNPSIIPHPDQTGMADGGLRVVLSVRAVGEGHRSSLGFRTGSVDAVGQVAVDPTPDLTMTGSLGPAVRHDAGVFRHELALTGHEGENADYILDALGSHFSPADLEARLTLMTAHLDTRPHGGETMDVIRGIARRSYAVDFSAEIPLAERVLRPVMAAESNGIEDARFLRFTEDDGTVTHYATYTAYDGRHISQQLLQTDDFASFVSAPIVGPAAANKGMALFPRRIGGRYAALSRADRESNSVAFSDNPRVWAAPAIPCQVPARDWELLQLGNCGAPIETSEGWLVLTHGVGPMRTYRIGALLLDLDDPTVVLGQLREPLLEPAVDEQDGYVPNVVYSCGALVHADTLVLPYGIGDAAIGIA